MLATSTRSVWSAWNLHPLSKVLDGRCSCMVQKSLRVRQREQAPRTPYASRGSVTDINNGSPNYAESQRQKKAILGASYSTPASPAKEEEIAGVRGRKSEVGGCGRCQNLCAGP